MAKKTELKKTELSKKIAITLSDRILISSLLPTEGDYTFHIVKKELLTKVAVTQDEVNKFEIKEVKPKDGSPSFLNWNPKGGTSKFEYDFTTLEKNEIKLALRKISDDKKLQQYHLNLYEIFAK